MLHPEWVEDVLAQVVAEGLAGDVLHRLPERGEAVVAVDPLRAGLDLLRQPAAVVLTEGLQVTRLHPRPRPGGAGRTTDASSRPQRCE